MTDLHVKHRPDNFRKVFGNHELVKTLSHKVKNNELNHVVMFSGPPGTGKTTFARLCAAGLGITDKNVIELNMADNTGVDNARDIAKSCLYMPLVKQGDKAKKAYILDEFHRATPNAQDCLLKPFEDCPDFAYFFICTTDPQKVVKTIKSRAQQFTTQSLDMGDLIDLLEYVCDLEAKQVDPKVLRKIAQSVEGSARDALVNLSKVISETDVEVALAMVTPTGDTAESIEICRTLANVKMAPEEKWDKINELLDKIEKPDWESLRLAVAGYMASICRKGMNGMGDYALEIGLLFQNMNLQYGGRSGFILVAYDACKIRKD